MSEHPISDYRLRLAAQVKENLRQEFGLAAPLSLFSQKVVEALVDAHVLRIFASRETEITAEKIRTLRDDARAVVLFDL